MKRLEPDAGKLASPVLRGGWCSNARSLPDEVIAEELGLKAALGDNFATAKNGKKDEFIKKLMGLENFVYEGKVPKVLKFIA